MNTIKLSGKVVKKEKVKKNDYFVKVVLAVPLHLRICDEGIVEQEYYYVSFLLFKMSKEDKSNLRKGSQVRIIGEIGGNCDEDGNNESELIIIPKSITKGVI